MPISYAFPNIAWIVNIEPLRRSPLGRAFVASIATGAVLAGCGGSSSTHNTTNHVATASSNPATTTVTTTQKAPKHTSSLPTKTSHHKFKGCPPICGY